MTVTIMNYHGTGTILRETVTIAVPFYFTIVTGAFTDVSIEIPSAS